MWEKKLIPVIFVVKETVRGLRGTEGFKGVQRSRGPVT